MIPDWSDALENDRRCTSIEREAPESLGRVPFDTNDRYRSTAINGSRRVLALRRRGGHTRNAFRRQFVTVDVRLSVFPNGREEHSPLVIAEAGLVVVTGPISDVHRSANYRYAVLECYRSKVDVGRRRRGGWRRLLSARPGGHQQ